MARVSCSVAAALAMLCCSCCLAQDAAPTTGPETPTPGTKQGSLFGNLLNKGEASGQQKLINPQLFAALLRPLFSYLSAVSPATLQTTGADYDSTGTTGTTANTAASSPFSLFSKDKTSWLASLFGGATGAVGSINPSYSPFAGRNVDTLQHQQQQQRKGVA